MTSSGINLVMTVIGFTVSTMFIVFVCTRLICARIHLTASRRSFARASGSNLSILERGSNGVVPLVVANFPTKKYRELCLSSKENAQCSVCLSEYHGEDTLRILPVCGHSFHAACVDIWLQQHPTCPVCRVSLREAPERNWFMQPMFSSAVRSQHIMQYANPYYCHCMENGHRHFASPLNSQTMEPIEEEAQCRPERDAGESFSVTSVNHNHLMTKEDSGNRKVESPSTL